MNGRLHGLHGGGWSRVSAILQFLRLQALRGDYAFVLSSAPRNGVDKTILMTEPWC